VPTVAVLRCEARRGERFPHFLRLGASYILSDVHGLGSATRTSPFLISLLLCATSAHADNKTYLAASTEALAGGGAEGFGVTAVGLDATAGMRLSRFFALDLFFVGVMDTQPHRLPGGGQECSGNYTQQLHWESLGFRFWIRALHSSHVDFSIAPPNVAGGAAFAHRRLFAPASGICAQLNTPRDFHGALAVFGLITFALEVRFDERFAWRFMAGAEIDLAFDAGLGALSVMASAGPVFHF